MPCDQVFQGLSIGARTHQVGVGPHLDHVLIRMKADIPFPGGDVGYEAMTVPVSPMVALQMARALIAAAEAAGGVETA